MSSEVTTSFSTSGEDAITQTLDVQPDQTAKQLSSEEFDAFYEIDRTAEEIIKGDFKRIALQFPDELLHDSVPIYRRLKKLTGDGRDLYVLADTSYGSCCVDEVASQHVNADAMVHYGHACLSQTSRLPVIYVFGKKPLDADDCVHKLIAEFRSLQARESSTSRNVILRHDVVYTHLAGSIADKLRSALGSDNIPVVYDKIPNKTYPASPTETSTETSPTAESSTTNSEISPQNKTIFYVGPESLSLTNLLVTHSQTTVITYDPTTQHATVSSTKTNKLLMKRYAIVQKARDSDVFGILVGTLGVANYLPLIKHVRSLLSQNQKKSYTISVGKLNPAKLANFMEIECFVLVACPENSMIDAKGFYRPIVTPFELEIALRAERSWTGRYVLDFQTLLGEAPTTEPGSDKKEEEDEEDEKERDEDQPEFSLVTGKYRQAKRYGGTSTKEDQDNSTLNTDSDALILRSQDSALAVLSDSAAAQFLQQRTYQGLEQRLGEDTPSVLEQGRSGIARGYQDDRRNRPSESA